MIWLGLILIALTAGVPFAWFFSRRQIHWSRRGLLDITVSAIYFALIFEVVAIFQGALT